MHHNLRFKPSAHEQLILIENDPSLKGVLKQIKDIVFLDFDLVQEVRISHLQKKIFFKVAINEGDTNFYIDFENHEDDEILQILKKILKKEITFVEKRFVY